MNARNIVISREQAETILDQETCDRLFAASPAGMETKPARSSRPPKPRHG